MREIVLVEKHPKGGHVITIQEPDGDRVGTGGLKQTVYLRLSHGDWYLWPTCKKISPGWSDLEHAWDSHQVRLSHNPPVELKIRTTGNPHRCMFCHDGMSGLAAYCLKCRGAMHLACSSEAGDRCSTPGCDDETDKKSDKRERRERA